jgi:hypothetical protein
MSSPPHLSWRRRAAVLVLLLSPPVAEECVSFHAPADPLLGRERALLQTAFAFNSTG